MRLQIALDFLREDFKPESKEKALKIAKDTADYIDIIEAGCPMNFLYGVQFVRDVRKLAPKTTIYADLKIWTLEDWEVRQAFEAGADMVQLQAFSADESIKNAVKIAKQYKKQIAINFDGYLDAQHDKKGNYLERLTYDVQQGEKGSILERAIEVDKMGVDYIGILWYTVHDPNYWELLKRVRKAVKADIAVGGGLTLESLDSMLKGWFTPDIVIVGRSIIDAPNPRQARESLQRKDNEILFLTFFYSLEARIYLIASLLCNSFLGATE